MSKCKNPHNHKPDDACDSQFINWAFMSALCGREGLGWDVSRTFSGCFGCMAMSLETAGVLLRPEPTNFLTPIGVCDSRSSWALGLFGVRAVPV